MAKHVIWQADVCRLLDCCVWGSSRIDVVGEFTVTWEQVQQSGFDWSWSVAPLAALSTSWAVCGSRGKVCHTLGMKTDSVAPSYKGFRFPQEIIAHAVWLYHRFNLSYRDVEELLAARGVIVTYETVRQWCLKFGQQFAHQLRRRRAQPGDKWHCDVRRFTRL
jgi:hypothetical protein